MRIAKALASGESPDTLAQENGLTLSYVRHIANEFGISWVAAKKMRMAKRRIEERVIGGGT
jgi:hypothetical protein